MKYKKTAAQAKWQAWQRDQGCINHPGTPAETEHMYGASTKSGGEWIGQFATLPLCYHCHRDPNYPYSKATSKKAHEAEFGTQKEQFQKSVTMYYDQNNALPFSDEKFTEIMEYSKSTA